MTRNILRCVVLSVPLSLPAVGLAKAQDAGTADIKKGRELAVLVCSYCHMAAPEQVSEPILQPPARSLEIIMRNESLDAAVLEAFLKSPHVGGDHPRRMPNPQLLDYQIKPVIAYLLSLRK